jgi:hypothetical protein
VGRITIEDIPVNRVFGKEEMKKVRGGITFGINPVYPQGGGPALSGGGVLLSGNDLLNRGQINSLGGDSIKRISGGDDIVQL